MNKEIVGCYAGLSAVDEFSENDPLCGKLDFGRAVHNTGAFAAQLQNGGGQGFGRVPQYLFSHALAAGKANQVELLFQQSGVFFPASGHNSHIPGVKTFADELFDHRAGGRRIGTGLHNGGIPGGNGVCQGIKRQKERIIPWAHNQGVPIGRGLLIASGHKLGQGRVHPALPGKAAGMADHIMKLRQDQPRLAHEALKTAFPQIFGQGFADLPLVFLNGVIQFFETFNAKIHGKRCAAAKKSALLLKNLLNIQKMTSILSLVESSKMGKKLLYTIVLNGLLPIF